ncbi:MAG: FlgB family protein [Gemmobacter sp.]
MFDTGTEVVQMARALARHAAARQGVIARNVAHADTPGYRAVDLPAFGSVWRDTGQTGMRATRPGHGLESRLLTFRAVAVDGGTSPNGNSVSLEAEMVRAADARAQHDLALAIQRSLSGTMRSALGRR